MPKIAGIGVETPVNVEMATRVFGSPVRVQLLRYYRDNPGSQTDAADALGLAHRSVGHNIRELVDAGVVTEAIGADRRSRTYQVNVDRLTELLDALRDFSVGGKRRRSRSPGGR